MPTTVTIPIHVVEKIKDRIEAAGGINAWIASKGFTVTNRERHSRYYWKITLAENLTAQQKAAVENIITNAAQVVAWS